MAQKSKMKTCAGKWKRSGKRGSYRKFMSTCLRKGRKSRR